MWDHKALSRIDFRTIPILLALMVISVLVIAATTGGLDRWRGRCSAFPPC